MTPPGTLASRRAYEAQPERRAYKKAYDARPERKIYKRDYNSRLEVKAAKRAYRARPEIKAQDLAYDTAPEQIAKKATYRQRARFEVLAGYGGRCVCCGESTPQFLAIDHVNGGGTKHRRTFGKGTKLFLWLKRENFPSDFQLLCHNCNMATGLYGRCPHRAGESRP